MHRTTLMTIILFLLFTPKAISQIEISGRITDCENSGMPGVNVILKKTTRWVSSDIEGFYKISVPDSNSILKFSAKRYIKQKIKVSNQSIINVKLIRKSRRNQDVEVIGYKPVIYLYPEKEEDISLLFKYNGTVLVTYPEYNKGWSVKALPNGKLTNKVDNKEYSYLFWEGKRIYTANETQYSNGFVVHRDSTVDFLQRILPKIGLNPNEYNEFIVFWLPQLLINEWNFIYFRIGSEYNTISENFVNPRPDSEIRVFMEFKRIEKPFNVRPQTIETPIRQGFTLVEWGGSILNQEIWIKDEDGKFKVR